MQRNLMATIKNTRFSDKIKFKINISNGMNSWKHGLNEGQLKLL